MQTSISWESRLLLRAHEASGQASIPTDTTLDQNLLARAYAFCDGITRQHSRTFTLASTLLPPGKRRAVRALYAFCRTSDDLVDCPDEKDPLQALDQWRVRSLSGSPDPANLVATAWADSRLRFGIPARYAEQLLDGVASDVNHRRYATFDELASYCYSVASTVGLMSMHIIGYRGPEAIPYAVKLGVALQLTNILRDVGEDWTNGRLYLPQDEMRSFGLSEADLEAGQVTPQWRKFIRFQIERARRLYAEAWPGIAMLNRDGRFSIAAAADLYEAILDDIQVHDYDVFSRRAHLGALGKLRQLPSIWLRTQAMDEVTVWYDN